VRKSGRGNMRQILIVYRLPLCSLLVNDFLGVNGIPGENNVGEEV